jgi:hypothetical protein
VSPLIAARAGAPRFPPPQEPLGDVAAQLAEVDRAIIGSRCKEEPSMAGFDRIARDANLTYYARKP